MNLGYLFAAIALGVCFAAQPAINGMVVRILGSPIAAATLSVVITLVCCLAFLLITSTTPSTSSLTQLPWWVVLGGLIGALVVVGGAAIAPVTGVAVFFVCLIAGQLLGSVFVDYVGAFGMEQRPISLLKAMGVLLALGGAILVRIG